MAKGSAVWLPCGWTAAVVSRPTTTGGLAIVRQPYVCSKCFVCSPTCRELGQGLDGQSTGVEGQEVVVQFRRGQFCA